MRDLLFQQPSCIENPSSESFCNANVGNDTELTGRLMWRSDVQMKEFCEDQETCRHVQLLRYFGETLSSGACKNTCDNCLRKAGQKHDPDWPELVSSPPLEICKKPCLSNPASKK